MKILYLSAKFDTYIAILWYYHMTFHDCHKCHKMSFYDIYDSHKVIWKYGNMGIKLTVSIPLLQKNTRFSIFTDLGIKKTILDIFKISSFVLPFKKWGSFEGPLRLVVQQKKLHIWKWHDNGHQMRYLRSWFEQKWKLWNTLMCLCSHQGNCYQKDWNGNANNFLWCW